MEATLPSDIEAAGPPNTVPESNDGLAGALAAQHGVQTGLPEGADPGEGTGKRVGRPPSHGLYSKAAGSDGKNPVRLPRQGEVPGTQMDPEPAPRVIIPPDLLTKVIHETITVGENF